MDNKPGGDIEVGRPGSRTLSPVRSAPRSAKTVAAVITTAGKCICGRCAIAAAGCATFIAVLQQEWFPPPISQLPAILRQHAISASVMDVLGKQASTGASAHRKTTNKIVVRRTITTQCYCILPVAQSAATLETGALTPVI
jgi:hypothetical protein